MKYALKVIFSCKKAVVCEVLHIIIATIVFSLSALNILVITNLLEYPSVEKFLILVGIQISVVVLSYYKGKVSRMGGNILFTNLSNRYADKVLSAEYEMFTKFSCSYIITTQEQLWKFASLQSMLTRLIISIIQILINLTGIWYVGKALILPVGVIYLLGCVVLKNLFRKFVEIDSYRDRLKHERNKETDAVINGFEEVRSHCTQKHHQQSIHSTNREILNTMNRKNVLNAKVDASYEMIDGCATIVCLGYLLRQIGLGLINATEGLSIIMYLYRLLKPLSMIADIITDFSDSVSMVDQYRSIMDYENNVKDGIISLKEFDSEITFRNVDSSYNDSDQVLNDLSLTIPKGKRIGICGPSGGGKSTIFKLLTKSYQVDYGWIEVDRVALDQIKADSWLDKIAVMQQNCYVFDDTIRNNIVYGNWNRSMKEIEDACKKANIWEFIQSLPDGLDTKVGPRGLKLSGGQQQRIGIARIFLQDPEIILLDEATSALDNESEKIVQEAMNQLQGKTIVVIAHRLTTIKDSDIIYVVKNHKVIEQGTHEQLMEMNGYYTKLVNAK